MNYKLRYDRVRHFISWYAITLFHMLWKVITNFYVYLTLLKIKFWKKSKWRYSFFRSSTFVRIPYLIFKTNHAFKMITIHFIRNLYKYCNLSTYLKIKTTKTNYIPSNLQNYIMQRCNTARSSVRNNTWPLKEEVAIYLFFSELWSNDELVK